MKPQKIFQDIYNAAINMDTTTLFHALQQGSINILVEENGVIKSPVERLAYQNKQAAAQFLLSYGADQNAAVRGYAEGGHDDQVELELKVNGADINAAVEGYARGGHVTAVNKLLARGASKDSAVLGYARSGHFREVRKLLEMGASKDCAVRGYAQGGHYDAVDALLFVRGVDINAAVMGYAEVGDSRRVWMLLAQGADINAAVMGYAEVGNVTEVNKLFTPNENVPIDRANLDVNVAVQGYARGGHIAQVNALLRQGASKDSAVHGYARGGHVAQVNALLERGASKDYAVWGYAQGGYVDQVNEFLAQGVNKGAAVKGYQQGGYADQAAILKLMTPGKGLKHYAEQGRDYQADIRQLFEKLDELRNYGNTLYSQKAKQKGSYATQLADEVRTQVVAYLNHPEVAQQEAVSKRLSELIAESNKTMGHWKDRKLKDIVAHIVVALTGIGLIFIVGKKYLSESKSGFLYKTKRQAILSDIHEKVELIKKRDSNKAQQK